MRKHLPNVGSWGAFCCALTNPAHKHNLALTLFHPTTLVEEPLMQQCLTSGEYWNIIAANITSALTIVEGTRKASNNRDIDAALVLDEE